MGGYSATDYGYKYKPRQMVEWMKYTNFWEGPGTFLLFSFEYFFLHWESLQNAFFSQRFSAYVGRLATKPPVFVFVRLDPGFPLIFVFLFGFFLNLMFRYFLFVLYFTMLSVSDMVQTGTTMPGKEFRRSGSGLIEIISRHLRGGTVEHRIDLVNTESRHRSSWENFWMKVWSVTVATACSFPYWFRRFLLFAYLYELCVAHKISIGHSCTVHQLCAMSGCIRRSSVYCSYEMQHCPYQPITFCTKLNIKQITLRVTCSRDTSFTTEPFVNLPGLEPGSPCWEAGE
jgi:hypothetical protein